METIFGVEVVHERSEVAFVASKDCRGCPLLTAEASSSFRLE